MPPPLGAPETDIRRFCHSDRMAKASSPIPIPVKVGRTGSNQRNSATPLKMRISILLHLAATARRGEAGYVQSWRAHMNAANGPTAKYR